MFGYRQRPTMEELKSWKKQGIKVNLKDRATELMPSMVEPEEAIRNVLLCRLPGEYSWQIPLTLRESWQAICPQFPFVRLQNLAADICVSLTNAQNEKMKAEMDSKKNG